LKYCAESLRDAGSQGFQLFRRAFPAPRIGDDLVGYFLPFVETVQAGALHGRS
jgi:hypothetical protein